MNRYHRIAMLNLRKICFALVILISGVAFSQQKEFLLEWKNNKEVRYSEKDVFKLHGFQTPNFVYNDVNKTVRFEADFQMPFVVDESNVNIVNVSYQNLSSNQLRHYNQSAITSDLDLKIKNTLARNKRGVYLSFNPIVNQGGVIKKVTAIRLDFQQGSAAVNRAPAPSITNSAMAEGEWYRFYVENSGVFRMDRNFFRDLGVDVDNVNPQNIRLFGNGGRSIPLLNANVQNFDITENAVKFVGQDDGAFNDSDYMLFYGESTRGWVQENASHINPYMERTYYYINISSTPGKRIQAMTEPTGVSGVTIDTFNEYQFHEVDKVNIVRLGRKWYGESFEVTSSRSFDFSFPRRVETQPFRVHVNVAAAAGNSTTMALSINGNQFDNLFFSATGGTTYAREDFHNGNLAVAGKDFNIGLSYNNGGNPGAKAYLDFIAIETLSELRSLGKQFQFKNNQVPGLIGVGTYQVSNATNVAEVWNVTDKFNVTTKVNSGASTLNFKANMGSEQTYIAIDPSDYYSPLKEDSNTRLSNLNLKGTIFNGSGGSHEDFDYLVITPNVFRAQAQRLANINNQYNGYRTRVVTLEDIYAEFNTGNQDIGAIRNFVRYVYSNGVTDKLKYLCLFGDASYDVKDRESINHNYFPTYQTLASFSLVSSYMSDDYFGMMDESEGAMTANDKLDIAVGRIIAHSNKQANEMVAKVEQYHKNEAYGSWRNRFMIVSDDVDHDWEASIQKELDLLADDIVTQKPFLNATKVHTDSYLQQTSAGGELYPAAASDMINNIQLGTLFVNFFGHGGEDGLAHERIFQKGDAQEVVNEHKYNVFVTVTCEFTRFDNPFRTTAGEYTFWNPRGGAVNLLTTTREIFMGLGINVNKELAKNLFDFNNTGYVTVAEALRLTKNAIPDQLRRVVFCVGDPGLKLAIPKPDIRLTKINDVPITDPNVSDLQALGRVKISGEVVDTGGSVITSYNGLLSTTIYDKEQQRVTLANDGTLDFSGNLIKLNYKTLGEIIYRGQATVKNGLFEFEFVVPKDIAIPVGNGRISFYAKRDGVLEDQNGFNTAIKIGGINTSAPADNDPPQITAFMNDESFVSGGVTNKSPFLLLRLSDLNGINTASGIGHDITAVLDGDESNPFVLNDYYETEPDDFTRGKVKFQFKDLAPGLHTLRVKAWDVYNNSNTAEIQFVVVDENEELKIDRVLNYPNPFVDYTEFWFSHNSSNQLDVMVQIYTVSGKLIKTIRGNTVAGSSLSRDLKWDGRDDFGDKVGKGVYVYKLFVKSPTTNRKTMKFEKLVIL